MPYIDLHCDTFLRLYQKEGAKGDLERQEGLSIDLDRMVKAGQRGQVFAVFLPPQDRFQTDGLGDLSDDALIEAIVALFNKNLKTHADILAPVRSVNDLDDPRILSILSMEDCRAIDGQMDKIDAFFNMGFRSMGLTWNFDNCLGHPNSDDPARMQKGLTPFGKEAVLHMQALGMLVDISHLSDGGAWDALNLCTKPVVATHSNARRLCGHPRNLSDALLRRLGEQGGITGLNFCPAFLKEGSKESRIEDLVLHARAITDVAGMESLALGTDFDGISGELEISSPTEMDRLFDALKKASFSEDQIEQFQSKNALRVLKTCLPAQ